MSRRKTKCVAFEATSPAPHGSWKTYCGRVLAEDDAALLTEFAVPGKGPGICRQCFSKLPISDTQEYLPSQPRSLDTEVKP